MVAPMGTFSKLTSWRSATRAIRLSKLDGHDFFHVAAFTRSRTVALATLHVCHFSSPESLH